MSVMSIAENVERVRERILAACLRSGRSPEDVALMAVSKFQERQAVEEAWAAGLRLFGESRVQEAQGKFGDFGPAHPGTSVHLIGSLQRNKAKPAAALFDCIQSLDRDELALELGKQAAALGRSLPVLLEMHTGEDSKRGYPDLDALYRATELVLGMPSLKPAGLMTMAPFTKDEAAIRASFRKLMMARDGLARRFPEQDWNCLSMGMTNDFELAVEEGSTLLRVGTAIFGGR